MDLFLQLQSGTVAKYFLAQIINSQEHTLWLNRGHILPNKTDEFQAEGNELCKHMSTAQRRGGGLQQQKSHKRKFKHLQVPPFAQNKPCTSKFLVQLQTVNSGWQISFIPFLSNQLSQLFAHTPCDYPFFSKEMRKILRVKVRETYGMVFIWMLQYKEPSRNSGRIVQIILCLITNEFQYFIILVLIPFFLLSQFFLCVALAYLGICCSRG